MGSKRRGKRPLSKKSINNHLSVLSSVFAFALERVWVDGNPAKGTRLNVERTGFNWITAGESTRFLQALAAEDPHYHPVFLAALRTGMRQGEWVALRWQDVHLDSDPPCVIVRRSRSHGVPTSTNGNRVRRVPLHDDLRAVLRDVRGEPRDLVFTAPDGTQLTGNKLKNPMRRAKPALGRPELRFHDLRHSFASQLTAQRIPLQVVQGLLGHSDIATTAKYSHPSQGQYADAVGALPGLSTPEALCAK